jgi:copper chaperone CopZ
MQNTAKLEFKLEGMHCGGCVTRLTHTLKRLKGVQVEDVQIGAAQVTYEKTAITPEEIQAAIRQAGWESTFTSTQEAARQS